MSLLRTIACSLLCAGVGVSACSSDDTERSAVGDPAPSEPVEELAEGPAGEREVSDEVTESQAISDALDANPNDPDALAWQARFKAAVDERAGLFLTLDIEEGHAIKFYEPEPGARMIVELMQEHQTAILVEPGSAASFVKAFQVARPGEAVPEAVQEAEARGSDPMMMEPNTEPELEPGGDLSSKPEVPSNQLVYKHQNGCVHFEDDHNGCPISDDGWCVCQPHITGNSGPFARNATHSRHALAPINGNISATLKVGSSTFPFDIAQGQHFSVGLTSSQTCGCPGAWWACGVPSFCVLSHSVQVHNASTDDYRWGACFDFDQSFACP